MVSFDKTIPPGGVGKITLQVDTSDFQGKITKNAQVFTNAANLQKTRIYLSIDVRPYIVVEPSPRVILSGIVGEDLRRVLRIHSGDGHPLEFTSVDSNLGEGLEHKLSPIGDSHRYELEVVTRSSRRKITSGYMRLKTNHPRKKELKLLIYVRIRPELEVLPERIAFRYVSRSGSKIGGGRRVITVVNNRGNPFKLRELNYNKEYFRVQPLSPTDTSSTRHRVEVAPLLNELPAGRVNFEDTLIIKTDVARTRELTVPMTIRLEAN